MNVGLVGELDRLDQDLASAGLNVGARVATSRLVPGVSDPDRLDAENWPSLLIWGSGGRSLWDAIQPSVAQGCLHPIDEHVGRLGTLVESRLKGMGLAVRVLFPGVEGTPPFPVTEAGRVAGLGHRSAMGLSIHPDWGLWLAYRLVVAVDQQLPERVEPSRPSPCTSCATRPCEQSCPVSAVGGPKGLDGARCLPYRIATGSRCASSCLSRLACPVGSAYRYPPRQLAHHHGHAHALWRSLSGDLPPPGVAAWEAEK